MMSTESFTLHKILVSNLQLMDAVRYLLTSGWKKKEDGIFYRKRNTYTIELNSSAHPMWDINVISNGPEFDESDWKLRQDFRSLKNLGKSYGKKLYVSDSNREELERMVDALRKNHFNLIYDNDYLVIRNKPNGIKIFKLAATLELVEQKDGWYVGERKIL